MIDAVLAKKFINRVSKYTDYNINIMDDRGIIIASRDHSRIGTFHEIALQIMQGSQDAIIVRSDEEGYGVRNGVNMAIYCEKKKEGVIGITGDPDEVEKSAMIIKMAVEVMLEHELLLAKKVRGRNQKEQFLSYLLYGTDVRPEDYHYYTDSLKLKEDVTRLPILISIHDEIDNTIREYILSLFRNQWKHSSQDMSCVTREGDILVYKIVDDLNDMMAQYKFFVADHISEVLRYMRSAGYHYSIYVGAFQVQFRGYKSGYEQCLWMKNTMSKRSSYYFYDHCREYLLFRVPFHEIRNICSGIEQIMDKKQIENFVEVMEALSSANYKLAEAGALMHVHKNTLAYRMDKFRELLHLDPIGNEEDRYFCNVLVYYFKMKDGKREP